MLFIVLGVLNFLVLGIFFCILQMVMGIPFEYPVGLLLGSIVSLEIVYLMSHRKLLVLSTAVLMMVLLGLSAVLYDFSYDGQFYHQEAAIQIANGWNFLWEKELPDCVMGGLWINAYPKALWVFTAAFYALTGNLLIGKVYQFILFVSCTGLTYFVMRSLLASRLQQIFFTMLFVFNPVAIQQMFTYMNDGAIYWLLLSLGMLAYIRYFMRNSKINVWGLDISFIGMLFVLVNLKFTALGYAMVYCFALALILFFCRSKEQAYYSMKLSVIALCLGVVFIGFNPYVTNTLRHGHPFWPLMGQQETVDIMAPMETEHFLVQNRVVKLGWSIFSQTRSLTLNDESMRKAMPDPVLKIPGMIYRDELYFFTDMDTKVAGFGPWFSLEMVLFLAGIAYLLKKGKIKKECILLLLGIILSVIINPECWWARYCPQFYVLPILVFLLLMRSADNKGKYIGHFAVVVALINIGIVSMISFSWFWRAESIYKNDMKSLQQIAQQSSNPLLVDFGQFESNRVTRFEMQGISYKKFDKVYDDSTLYNVMKLYSKSAVVKVYYGKEK